MLLHRGNSYVNALCLERRCRLAGHCIHKAWPACALFGLDEIFWKSEQVYNKDWIQAVLQLLCHRRSAKKTVAAAFLISQPQHPFNTKKWSLWKKVNEEETVTYRIVQGKYPCQRIIGSENALLQLDSSQLSLAVPSPHCYQGSTREVHLALFLLQPFYQAGPAVWIAHQCPHTLSPAQPRLVLKTHWPTHGTQKMLRRRPVGTCPATVGFFCPTALQTPKGRGCWLHSWRNYGSECWISPHRSPESITESSFCVRRGRYLQSLFQEERKKLWGWCGRGL